MFRWGCAACCGRPIAALQQKYPKKTKRIRRWLSAGYWLSKEKRYQIQRCFLARLKPASWIAAFRNQTEASHEDITQKQTTLGGITSTLLTDPFIKSALLSPTIIMKTPYYLFALDLKSQGLSSRMPSRYRLQWRWHLYHWCIQRRRMRNRCHCRLWWGYRGPRQPALVPLPVILFVCSSRRVVSRHLLEMRLSCYWLTARRLLWTKFVVHHSPSPQDLHSLQSSMTLETLFDPTFPRWFHPFHCLIETVHLESWTLPHRGSFMQPFRRPQLRLWRVNRN